MTEIEKAVLEETLADTIGKSEEVMKLAEELELEVTGVVKLEEK